MKKHLPILIGLLIILTSCKQKESQKTADNHQKPTTEIKAEIEETPIPEQYIENDSILTELESDLYKIAYQPKLLVLKEPVRNRHTDPDVIVMDTIITRSFDKTKIEFYKTLSEDEDWIYKATIQNSDFKLLDSIRVGTKRDSFEKRIKTELQSDFIKIGNLEQTSVFVFKFEDGILKSIDYEGYLD